MGGDSDRHELFEIARRRAEWSITDLWVAYLSLGGDLDLFAIRAYLHGLAPLPSVQQDILANAVNERLDDLFRAARVPYLHADGDAAPPSEDPVDVLEGLLGPEGGPASLPEAPRILDD